MSRQILKWTYLYGYAQDLHHACIPCFRDRSSRAAAALVLPTGAVAAPATTAPAAEPAPAPPGSTQSLPLAPLVPEGPGTDRAAGTPRAACHHATSDRSRWSGSSGTTPKPNFTARSRSVPAPPGQPAGPAGRTSRPTTTTTPPTWVRRSARRGRSAARPRPCGSATVTVWRCGYTPRRPTAYAPPPPLRSRPACASNWSTPATTPHRSRDDDTTTNTEAETDAVDDPRTTTTVVLSAEEAASSAVNADLAPFGAPKCPP